MGFSVLVSVVIIFILFLIVVSIFYIVWDNIYIIVQVVWEDWYELKFFQLNMFVGLNVLVGEYLVFIINGYYNVMFYIQNLGIFFMFQVGV